MNDAEIRKQEDLFVRIALDNKLVSKWHVKKATEEQDRRAKEEGKRPALGQVLLTLGYLTDRQFQSVENAQRYREQRDYDKRIGRQVLRTNMLDQAKVEECLEAQKQEYTKTGSVKPAIQVMQEKGFLTAAQIADVVKAIEARDKSGRSQTSGANARPASLAVSGPISIGGLDKRGSEDDVTPVKLEEKPPAPDARAVNGLRDAPTEEHEVEAPAAAEADAEDEDEEAEDADDAEEAGDEEEDGEDAEDAEDGEEDEADEDEEAEEASDSDSDEEDEDEEGEDDAEDEEAEDAAEEEEAASDSDEEEEDAEEASDSDSDEEDEEDEDADELANDLDDITDGDDVELDEADLETIEELESGSSGTGSEQGWAADAFDDRPLAKRTDTPSTALPAAKSTPSAAAVPASSAASPAPAASAAPAAKAAPVTSATPVPAKPPSSGAIPVPAKPLAATTPAGGTPVKPSSSAIAAAAAMLGKPSTPTPAPAPSAAVAAAAALLKPTTPAPAAAAPAKPASPSAPARLTPRSDVQKIEPPKPAAKADLDHSDESSETLDRSGGASLDRSGGASLDRSGGASLAAGSAHEIPGGELLEDSATANILAPAGEPLVKASAAQEKLAASTRGLDSFLKRVADDLKTSTPAPAPIAREVPAPDPSPAPTASSTLAPARAETKPALNFEDPAVRRAFERAFQRAMDIAWKVFLEEMGR